MKQIFKNIRNIKNIKNIKNIQLYFILILIIMFIIIYCIFQRIINVNLMFFMYDVYALFGLYWQLQPQYCSPMKFGFKPVMPIEFYAEFNKAIFPRIPSGDNTLNKEEVIRICDRNLEWLQKNGEICVKPINVEIIHTNDPEFKQKVMFYIKHDYPFVMRGVELSCFKTMRYDKLMKTAGNDKVYMSPSSEETCTDNIFTELKNIEKNKCYITNSTNLFNNYENLLPDSDMDIIKNIIDGHMENNSKQMFLGITKGTGTALHAAYTNNFYLMIQGQKKWTFFNPNQIALLYPDFQKKGIYMTSQSRFLNAENIDSVFDKFPLMKYAERYEVHLEEKDILYNPMSWYHSVYNKTDISVACSTRWSSKFVVPDNYMLRYGHMINPELRSYVKDIYIQNGVLGISQIDEHKHMIGEDKDAIPYWDKFTNDSHNLCKDEDCSINWHHL